MNTQYDSLQTKLRFYIEINVRNAEKLKLQRIKLNERIESAKHIRSSKKYKILLKKSKELKIKEQRNEDLFYILSSNCESGNAIEECIKTHRDKLKLYTELPLKQY